MYKRQPQSGNQYENGKQDLFAVVIAFRYILPGKDFLEFKRKLIKEIDRVNREVEHISEVAVSYTHLDVYKRQAQQWSGKIQS